MQYACHHNLRNRYYSLLLNQLIIKYETIGENNSVHFPLSCDC